MAHLAPERPGRHVGGDAQPAHDRQEREDPVQRRGHHARADGQRRAVAGRHGLEVGEVEELDEVGA